MSELKLQTLATAVAGQRQRFFAGAVCVAFGAASSALLPIASLVTAPMPGFVAVYQSALIVVYALTTYLFFAQYRRTRSLSLLLLAAGSLYVTLIVFAQLLSFPNVLVQGRLLGAGADTLTWLWTFWHVGPPAFALAYAVVEGSGRPRLVPSRRAGTAELAAICGTLVVAGLVTVVTTRHVDLLPKSVDGDDYSLIIWNGTGPGTQMLTLLALAVLCWRTRLRTVLQLWLAVSLLLLVFDNVLTMAGGMRGSLGWYAGRLEALMSGIVVLAVYLAEIDFLYGLAESTARARHRQSIELERARDNLALALDAAGMGDFELDLRGRGHSRRAARHDAIFGYRQPLEDWSADTLLSHVVPDDRASVRAAMAVAERDGSLDVQCRIKRAGDGAVRWIVMRGRTHRDDDGSASLIAGVVMDTTERREAEDRLSQAHKMEAIGQLTGGVAHDFNNLLTVIVGSLDMIARKPDNAPRVERLAASGLLAARRGAELTDKLLAFSRRKAVRPETVNPNRLLHDFGVLLRRAVGETITVRLDLDPRLDPVRLDRSQFENAILNLAVNARDAMPGGGDLTVRTGNAALTRSDTADLPDLAPGDYVLVSVSDTGQGFDPATMARAFEPFFTTKDVGKGTGLGLSQVYGFALQCGGQARILSEPGRGTTVELYLPRSSEAAIEPRLEGLMPLRHAADGEVVLVVEDEPAVLAMAVESLTELGYKTLTASDAASAIRWLEGRDRIDILFSDIIMPGGMNGVQLSVEARRIRPELKVLLTSGYTGSALDDQRIPNDLPLLGKPYRREELADKLQVVSGRR